MAERLRRNIRTAALLAVTLPGALAPTADAAAAKPLPAAVGAPLHIVQMPTPYVHPLSQDLQGRKLGPGRMEYTGHGVTVTTQRRDGQLQVTEQEGRGSAPERAVLRPGQEAISKGLVVVTFPKRGQGEVWGNWSGPIR